MHLISPPPDWPPMRAPARGASSGVAYLIKKNLPVLALDYDPEMVNWKPRRDLYQTLLD